MATVAVRTIHVAPEQVRSIDPNRLGPSSPVRMMRGERVAVRDADGLNQLGTGRFIAAVEIGPGVYCLEVALD